MQLIIITGLSGSGKSVVLRALEDTGYYCVDNLPATLLPQICENLKSTESKIAISIDTRSAALEALPENIQKLKLFLCQKTFYKKSYLHMINDIYCKVHPLFVDYV